MRNEQEINENSEQHKADLEPEQYFEDVFMDHDYFMQNNWCFTEYTSELITYIAGFVVRTVTRKINCLCCKQLFISRETQRKLDIYRTDKLLQQKNRDDLCQVSRDIIAICKTAEKTLRANQHISCKTKNILHVLIHQSERCLPSHILNTDIHIFRQKFDYRSQLIRLILKIFFNIRFKHETATYINFTQRVRMRNNKLTLFQNQ